MFTDDIFEGENGKIITKMCGQTLEVEDRQIPDSIHVGITACKGENRFTDFMF